MGKEQRRLRKRAERTVQFKEPWKTDRWFEVVSLFDANEIRPLTSADSKLRIFVMGSLEDVVILSVPKQANPKAVHDAMDALGERGIRALAFTDDIRFVKLRPLSDQEGKVIDEFDTRKNGIVHRTFDSERTELGSGLRVAGVERAESGDSGHVASDGVDPDGQEQQEAPRSIGG